MNKIKLLYDIFTTMKKKKEIKGIVHIEGKKDKKNIFKLENEFEKNMENGHMKANIRTEVNDQGKVLNHEGTTEFSFEDFDGEDHHGFMHHFHHYSHRKNRGVKERLNKVAFMFHILNELKVNDQENNGYTLSLNAKEIPEEIKNKIHHPHFIEEFHSIDLENMDLNVFINKSYEVKKIELTASGNKMEEKEIAYEMDILVEISLS